MVLNPLFSTLQRIVKSTLDVKIAAAMLATVNGILITWIIILLLSIMIDFILLIIVLVFSDKYPPGFYKRQNLWQ
ncbi:MAG: hypothetical protein MTP17_04575 [Candidatus Midichloria sp.]|nr:MAG: hypothetical protein MTP17_04575 [Candidatus Midichloria sp.]